MAAVESILATRQMPFCPGCGHTVVSQQLAQALQELAIKPLDVIEVSDIGCCGLIDGVLKAHTVHGLHGRSTALALGIRLGLENRAKKVVVIIGDGGATIGLQHLLEAARQNVDITVLLLDNMIYGMTGGQVSGLTPEPLKERKLPDEAAIPPFNIVNLVHEAGASYSGRVYVGAELKEKLKEALGVNGFSLLEILEMCPSHGVRKIRELTEIAGFPSVVKRNERPQRTLPRREGTSLLESLPSIRVRYSSKLKQKQHILIAGSAGGGIQSAGEILAGAGVAAGLQVTKKGEYPITVGTGFSIAEVVLSPGPIFYTGIERPDLVIAVSQDGWEKVKNRLSSVTRLIVDEQVCISESLPADRGKFREKAGNKGAALAAVGFWLKQSGILPLEALEDIVSRHPHSESLRQALQAGAEG